MKLESTKIHCTLIDLEESRRQIQRIYEEYLNHYQSCNNLGLKTPNGILPVLRYIEESLSNAIDLFEEYRDGGNND